MKRSILVLLIYTFCIGCRPTAPEYEVKTSVSIEGDRFLINGKPTFEGRTWNGYLVEGLLPNSRMVQGVFDDLNTETISKWHYPDTGIWDPERNTNEFVTAMPEWRSHGLLAFDINFQGGSPEGYSQHQPWENNAFDPDGTLRPAYTNRMVRIINKADELGMVVMLGILYFGQDERLLDENAVKNAITQAVYWVLDSGFENVIIEVVNEANNRKYDHDIISMERIHELVSLAKSVEMDGRRLLCGTSFNGGVVAPAEVVEVSDYIIVHGNGVSEPSRMTAIIEEIRALPTYTPKPIVVNEDDHYDFDQPENNFVAATKAYASWGFFDFRREGEGFDEGYQSVPVNWGISSERKAAFFDKVKEIFIE